MEYAMGYRYKLSCLLISALLMSSLQAQKAPPELQVGALTDNIHVIAGAGGNIAVFTGADGVFVIDDGMPHVVGPVAAAISTITAAPVRMIFNTHWHFDHAGGNEHFAANGTIIIAHDNVRRRMSTAQFSRLFNSETKPSPYAALPVVTFDNTVTFHLNGDTVVATHIPNGHTDGDAILQFSEANVTHLGDLFFNGRYPVIDISGGGSIEGMIAAVDTVLPMLNADTKVIPGHGPQATIEELRAYQDMMSTVVSRVRILMDEGKSVDEIVAKRPSINFDEQWAWDFMPPDRWIRIVYDSLVNEAAKTAANKSE
jgi:glyoxylase-like metal-dependent hydrolase (beta-lactamase superfamily II)